PPRGRCRVRCCPGRGCRSARSAPRDRRRTGRPMGDPQAPCSGDASVVDEHAPAVLGVLHVLAATIERAARIEQRVSHPEHVHVPLVTAFVRNTVAVMEQYIVPERLPEALDKLRALQAAAVPGTVEQPSQPYG